MKIMKLSAETPRNAVYMFVDYSCISRGQFNFFLSDEDGKLSPFWNKGDTNGDWCFCGAMSSGCVSGHKHWYGSEVIMIDSHVVNPSRVNLHKCLKAAKRIARKIGGK